MLNIIWCSFFIIGFLATAYNTFILDNPEVLKAVVDSSFAMAKLGFELALGLTGVMAFWLGILKIADNSGLVQKLTRFIAPVFRTFFPSIPKDHPAFASILMNLSANMLGLDNAATPFGLKAMKELEDLNENKGTASNAQIMFLVINTSAVTIIPISIFTYLYELGYANPTELFLPILLATAASTIAGITLTSLIQRIPLIKSGLIYVLLAGLSLVGIIAFIASSVPTETLRSFSEIFSQFFILSLITFFISWGLYKKIDVYQSFIDGAKESFKIAISIIPYLIAMLVAIGVLRNSGVLLMLTDFIKAIFGDHSFVDALPTAILKPLSGSGARAMMVDTIKTHGVESMVAKMVATIQGSTETTFYVLAIYFGSVKITKTRYALGAGLFADAIGAISAILVCQLFF